MSDTDVKTVKGSTITPAAENKKQKPDKLYVILLQHVYGGGDYAALKWANAGSPDPEKAKFVLGHKRLNGYECADLEKKRRMNSDEEEQQTTASNDDVEWEITHELFIYTNEDDANTAYEMSTSVQQYVEDYDNSKSATVCYHRYTFVKPKVTIDSMFTAITAKKT
jgi:hypothetical protein